ncbi:MAG: adenylate/guanylate cyclase domain-containing protein [Burkholderiaceae bacterium]
MEKPRTRYAKSGDIDIAYQVVGNGPLDLIVVPGWISHLDMHWQMNGYEAWVSRLTSFCRLIVFDKRGGGLSDRDVGDSSLEERMDDLRAVLDAVGSERAAVLGFSEGGSLAMLFAASYPERVQALVLFGTFPRSVEAPDFPEGKLISERLTEMSRAVDEEWGAGYTLRFVSPSLANRAAAVEFTGQFERASLSPRAARSHLKWVSQIDSRSVARSLRLPTLVMHRIEDQLIPIAGGRWLSENIPGARLVELPGNDHAPWSGDSHLFAAELEEFLTGSRGDVEIDRVLATVLFTDIVGSTERAVTLGDRGWKELLGQHHELVREELRRHRGVEQDTAGDGFFATFDGPARAVRCAQQICEVVGRIGLEVRAGVHIGECERTADKMAGIAVHIGARVMAQSRPGEVLVSSTVKDLVPGSGLTFVERGEHDLKGVPGTWRLYAAA